jgi:flagellar protein FliT
MPPEDGRLHNLRPAPPRGADLIARYEAIANVSRAMLVAAHADDWDEVSALEDRCRALIVELKAAARTTRLSVAEQRRRIELLRAILADDAEVRKRSEPWLRQLEQLLQPARGARRA